jgi:hypothetical protein
LSEFLLSPFDCPFPLVSRLFLTTWQVRPAIRLRSGHLSDHRIRMQRFALRWKRRMMMKVFYLMEW